MTLSGLSVRIGLAALALLVTTSVATATFDAEEKLAVRAHWAKAGRYLVEFADPQNPYQARQTPAGSVWLLDYARKARGNESAKVIPGHAPAAVNDRQKVWNDWIDAKYAHDEFLAAREANLKNQGLGLKTAFTLKEPAKPGPLPADLRQLAGPPPTFVAATVVKAHRVTFDDLVLQYQDNVKVRRKYAYYRFAEGVMDVGQRLSQTGLDPVKPLFTKAGVDESKLRVMAAVSLLEGGFDSVNTYDTGYVSVGFIQFASLARGSGSLGQVLLHMKASQPDAFDRDFRRFGLDVTPAGELVALDLASLQPTVGADAAKTIIADRRLIAVFQRAGRLSEPFRIAQIKTALDMYFPADETITVKLGPKTHTARVADLVRTEAGLATLMDRKVNTGNLGDLNRVVAGLMLSYNLQDIKQVAEYEHELVQAMVYRDNYLQAEDLTKPKPNPTAKNRGR